MQPIFTNEGIDQLRILVGTKANFEALRAGVAVDVSGCQTAPAASLPIEMPLLQVTQPSGDDRVRDDGDNAILLHRKLSHLTERAAANPRLWTTFAFRHYQDYMHKRWPLVDAKDESSARDKINDRYFVKRMGHKGYFRHGISRLWWTAHMTRLEGEPDIEKCYALTRFAFSRQEYQFGIFLRKFGASRHVVRSILEFFKENERRIQAAVDETPEPDKSFNNFIRYANKQMNIYGSVYVLDVLEHQQIQKLMERSAAAFYGRYWD